MATIKGTKLSDTATGTSGKDKIFGKGGDDTLFGGLGKDHLHGGWGDDLLYGGGGNDHIDGGKGDDLLYGGGGNDHIDGGKGFDTAVYTGNMDEYVITPHKGNHGDHGNNKWTISDQVASRDGTDQLKDVEWLQFNDVLLNLEQNISYDAGGPIDDSGRKLAGDMIVGSGIPADHFGVVQNHDYGVELGLAVHHRSAVPEPRYFTTDDYADGELHFTVDPGPAVAGGIPKAEWSFDSSVITGLDGETTDLGDFTFKWLIDLDPTAATSFLTLRLEPGTHIAPPTHLPHPGHSGYVWVNDATNAPIITDDFGNAFVTQNSQNIGFYHPFVPAPFGSPTFSGPAEYDIILQAYNSSPALIAENHIVVDVIV
jgi:hypothetical protein